MSDWAAGAGAGADENATSAGIAPAIRRKNKARFMETPFRPR